MRYAWLVLAVLGCSKPQKLWIDTHATQLHVGSLEADIPPGWRDFHELAQKPSFQPPEGSRMILLETDPDRGRIMVLPLAVPIQGTDRCQDVAKIWQEQMGSAATLSDAEGANFNGNQGCLMKISGRRPGKVYVVTPQGGSSASILCIGQGTEVDSACDKTVYGIHAAPPK